MRGGKIAPTAAVALVACLLSCSVQAKIPSDIDKQIALHRASFYGDTTICWTTPGLTKAQIEVCQRQPDATAVALDGLQMAVTECQYQMRGYRWNCSSLMTRTNNPYTNAIFKKGFKETAFAHAITTAGVTISVARACSQGLVLNCGCENYKHRNKGGWKWGGCSHNLRFGNRFTRRFLDSRENGDDFQSTVNLHNNQVGRNIVSSNMQIKCKCHGMSGSCELKTCWRATPDLRVVAKMLKEKYKGALFVNQSNLGTRKARKLPAEGGKKRKHRGRLSQLVPRKHKLRRDLTKELLYYKESPDFCERDVKLDLPGTVGRSCNRTALGPDSCSSLCCGRGYDLIRQRRMERCKCKFHWCCTVECQICQIEEWISVCK